MIEQYYNGEGKDSKIVIVQKPETGDDGEHANDEAAEE